jgi:hypothetical protein
MVAPLEYLSYRTVIVIVSAKSTRPEGAAKPPTGTFPHISSLNPTGEDFSVPNNMTADKGNRPFFDGALRV